MTYKNITLNGLKIPVDDKYSVMDLIERFFDLRCEFLVKKNSRTIPSHKFSNSKIKENDILQVITYSKYCYKLHKRTIFKADNNKI